MAYKNPENFSEGDDLEIVRAQSYFSNAEDAIYSLCVIRDDRIRSEQKMAKKRLVQFFLSKNLWKMAHHIESCWRKGEIGSLTRQECQLP